MELEDYTKRFMDSVIKGSEYDAEDIVAVVIGTSSVQGDIWYSIYLTERGVEESNKEEFKPIYDQLRKKVPELCIDIKNQAPVLSESIKRMGKKYIDLGGSDNLRRILVFYAYAQKC